MRGSLYAITEIILFVVGASLLGLLLGLLIRRPRPKTVRAAATAGPERVEIERRLAAAQSRSDDLESKLNAALVKVDSLQMQNSKLEELRRAEANLRSTDDIAALEEKAALVDRLEEEPALRDSALADREREIAAAAARIASLEGAAGDESAVAPMAAVESGADYVPPRQNPTGPGALTDVIEFEVGGAD
jgi:TolA-binding protein